MEKIFKKEMNLQVYLSVESVIEKYGSATKGDGAKLIKAFDRSLEEFRKLNIFAGITRVTESTGCDIFVTLATLEKLPVPEGVVAIDPLLAGVTRFKRHHNSSRWYAEVRMNQDLDWCFGPYWWGFFKFKPRFERWVNHEMLHAIGLPHTDDRVANLPSIMAESAWNDNTPTIYKFDKALARKIYGLPDPYEKFL